MLFKVLPQILSLLHCPLKQSPHLGPTFLSPASHFLPFTLTADIGYTEIFPARCIRYKRSILYYGNKFSLSRRVTQMNVELTSLSGLLEPGAKRFFQLRNSLRIGEDRCRSTPARPRRGGPRYGGSVVDTVPGELDALDIRWQKQENQRNLLQSQFLFSDLRLLSISRTCLARIALAFSSSSAAERIRGFGRIRPCFRPGSSGSKALKEVAIKLTKISCWTPENLKRDTLAPACKRRGIFLHASIFL